MSVAAEDTGGNPTRARPDPATVPGGGGQGCRLDEEAPTIQLSEHSLVDGEPKEPRVPGLESDPYAEDGGEA